MSPLPGSTPLIEIIVHGGVITEIRSPSGRVLVRKSPQAPLRKTRTDGSVVDALCVMFDGIILVHPERWEQFCRVVPSSGQDLTAGAVSG